MEYNMNDRITWPGPSLEMIIFSITLIGFFENSGNESWLQVNDVYVFGFEEEFDFGSSDANKNSLPFGSHFNSFDLTAQKRQCLT